MGGSMSRPVINADECSVCGCCIEVCPNGVLDFMGDSVAIVDEDACVACGDCMDECPMGAIEDNDEE